MKYLLTLFILSMALQPLQLQACPMEAEQGASHHAGMQHDTDMQEQSSHDCCDEPDSTGRSCEEAMSCGSCSLGINLLQSTAGALMITWQGGYFGLASDQLPDSYALPPFRPPIS